MTSWAETSLGRLTIQIYGLFDDYLRRSTKPDHDQHNALLEVRNLVVESVSVFLGEASIQKKYGVPIDGLSLVSFTADNDLVNPRSSWIPVPAGESAARPAGITNEEFAELSEKLGELFVNQGMYTSGLFNNVLELFREAYLRPTENRPFHGGTYTRLIFGSIADGETTNKQAIPCEICEENRVIDVCHIIPKRLNGTQDIDNVLFLCPTHHRLFDACMLTKEEWKKVDWTRKSPKSQVYAEKVLKIAQGKFWEKLEVGQYRKQTTWELDLHELYKENEQDIKT